MTIFFPSIVTNGLVLCLDAGNQLSYPGTGTTWNDLSRNGNNGTLTNGPVFNSGGSMVFDGVDDYISTNTNSSLTQAGSIQFTAEIWAKKSASNKDLNIGLGTALNKAHVADGKSAGAQFIISPHTDEEVIRATKAAGLISIPGVASPTDVGNAIKFGADALKFFPASSLGPNYLKAIREPFPGQTWMATGGISVDSVGEWIKAGCTAVGIGSPLTSGGASEIPNRIKAFSDAIKAAKQ